MYPLLVVIHETLISAEESLRLHADPNYYASYHCLIHRDGKVTYLVPAEYRAHAAANSAYTDAFGEVQQVNGSVDDFAYHIALETPFDGVAFPTRDYHIGYTSEQYSSCAFVCVSTGVRPDRITTHGDIVTPARIEPRCFNYDYFYGLYEQYRSTGSKTLDLGILDNVR